MLRSLRYLNSYFLKYKWHLLGGLFFIVLSNIFSLYPARVTRFTIDYLYDAVWLHKQTSSTALKQQLQKNYGQIFLFFFLIIVVSSVIKGVFMFFMRQTIIVMSRYIEFDLKNTIYLKYQRLPVSFYKQHRTGDLMARISEDVSQVRMYLGPAVMYAANLLVMFVLVIAVMISVNFQLTILVLLPLPMLSFGIYKVSNLINKKSALQQAQLSALSAFAQNTFAGIRLVKSYVREDAFANNFNRESLKYKDLAFSLIKTESLFSPLIMLLVGISTIITVFAGGIAYINGTVSLGNIAEFVIYVNMLTWPVTSLGWVSSIIQKAAVSQQRINEFLNEPEVKEGGTFQPDSSQNFSVRFTDVSFTYPESGICALRNISFFVPAGNSFGITGSTGSGKSTIAALLCRFYEPDSGEIYVNEIAIGDYDLQALRELLGYVAQDNFLFSDTIYNNMIFGVPEGLNCSKQQLEVAAQKACIADAVEGFPEGYHTIIGERGVTLSGGQKQRLCIARALLKKPSILLLDDCLSAIDTITERQILKNLEAKHHHCTSVFIGHRISTIMHAQTIILLDNHTVVEQGTHAELIELKGLYYQQYMQQHHSNGPSVCERIKTNY